MVVDFVRDEDGHWVAELSCAHRQHVRHRPPFEMREWTQTAEGRTSRIGSELDCVYCDQPSLPSDCTIYKTTPTFNAQTVPSGLLKDHRTKAGTWGRIVVLSGRLLYEIVEGDLAGAWVLRPGVAGIIEPTVAHHVALRGEVEFRVEFLRVV